MIEKITEDTDMGGLRFSCGCFHRAVVKYLPEPYRSILMNWDEVRAYLTEMTQHPSFDSRASELLSKIEGGK